MKFRRLALLSLFLTASGFAQEAGSGIDLAATVTGEAVSSRALTESPRDGSPLDGRVPVDALSHMEDRRPLDRLWRHRRQLQTLLRRGFFVAGLWSGHARSPAEHRLFEGVERRIAGDPRRSVIFGIRILPAPLRRCGEPADQHADAVRLLLRRGHHCGPRRSADRPDKGQMGRPRAAHQFIARQSAQYLRQRPVSELGGRCGLYDPPGIARRNLSVPGSLSRSRVPVFSSR